MKRFVLMLGADGSHTIEAVDSTDVDEMLKKRDATLIFTADTLEEAEQRRDEEIRRSQIHPL